MGAIALTKLLEKQVISYLLYRSASRFETYINA